MREAFLMAFMRALYQLWQWIILNLSCSLQFTLGAVGQLEYPG